MPALDPRPAWVAILFLLGARVAEAEPVRTASVSATELVPTASVSEEVLVRGQAPAARDPTATQTELSPARLLRAQRRGEDLGSLVDTVAGARVLDLGGPLAARRLTLRGGTPSQAAVVLDDVVLRSPFATGLDLGLLPTELLEGAAVSRGGQGAAIGEGALTGALSLRARRPGDQRGPTFAATVGSYDTLRLSGSLGASSLLLGGSWASTAGDFRYESRLPGLPVRERRRSNNDSVRGTVHLLAQDRVGSVDWSVLGAGAYRDAGVPGLADTPGESQTAREQQRAFLTRAKAVVPVGAARLRLGVDLHHLELDYQEPAQALASSTLFWASGADLAASLPLGEAQRLGAELRGGAEWSTSTVYGDQQRGRVSAALSDRVLLGPFLAYAGFRIEGAEGQPWLYLPRLGLEWSPVDAWRFRLGGGRSARIPTLDELFHPPEAGYGGNPLLVPEAAWAVEAAASTEWGPLSLQLVAFARRLEETIIYLNRNAFAIRPENLGAATAWGLEAEARVAHRWGLLSAEWLGSGAYLETELSATSAPMPTQPRWSGATELNLGFGPVELGAALRAFSSTFVTLRPTDENVVPAYLRVDASLIVAPAPFISVAASLLNLGDDRSLASVQRIPLPGRTLMLTLRLTPDSEVP